MMSKIDSIGVGIKMFRYCVTLMSVMLFWSGKQG